MSVIPFILIMSLFNWPYSEQRTFPDSFQFGVATASYQIEGGWNKDGKRSNIWDVYTHNHPEKVVDHSTGDVACDSYHLWQRDVQMLTELNVDFYRFSLSWSRILPTGQPNEINQAGVDYYNGLIDSLHENGIRPMVTLYHWDLPQPLQDLGGWTNPKMADYFADYAKVCFERFGDRVDRWLTMNEPKSFCRDAYETGDGAPGIFSPGVGAYLCGKTVLLAHAKAYRLYDKKYRASQQGLVSLALDSDFFMPKTASADDADAAERAMQMSLGWFAHPIFSKTGDYPEIMKERVLNVSLSENYPRSRLPSLTDEEIHLIKGTFDYFGLNHYTSLLVSNHVYNSTDPTSCDKDIGAKFSQSDDWPKSKAEWLRSVPEGFRKLLHWTKKQYGDVEIVVTENGFADNGTLNDVGRIDYYRGYLNNLLDAMFLDEVKVVGYTAWSLMDNMEWTDGYTLKFGLYQVDFGSPKRTRKQKKSLSFFQTVINDRIVPPDGSSDAQVILS